MPDEGQFSEGARVDKYSPEQVEYSRQLLGREPEGAELAAHHAAPAHGTTIGTDDQADADKAAKWDRILAGWKTDDGALWDYDCRDLMRALEHAVTDTFESAGTTYRFDAVSGTWQPEPAPPDGP